MAGKFMPDTNIVIALFAGDANVQREINDVNEVFLCSIVLGELYYGARKSARSAQNPVCHNKMLQKHVTN